MACIMVSNINRITNLVILLGEAAPLLTDNGSHVCPILADLAIPHLLHLLLQINIDRVQYMIEMKCLMVGS
jgi:hypothetical protein